MEAGRLHVEEEGDFRGVGWRNDLEGNHYHHLVHTRGSCRRVGLDVGDWNNLKARETARGKDMKQITLTLPTMQHWRTTLFWVVTAAGGAVAQYWQNGGLSWKECAMAAVWAGACYLMADGKSITESVQSP